jgi:hypothetical protein
LKTLFIDKPLDIEQQKWYNVFSLMGKNLIRCGLHFICIGSGTI